MGRNLPDGFQPGQNEAVRNIIHVPALKTTFQKHGLNDTIALESLHAFDNGSYGIFARVRSALTIASVSCLLFKCVVGT